MKQFFQTREPIKASRRQVLGIGATLAGGALIVGCSPSMIGKAMSVAARRISATWSRPPPRSSRRRTPR